MNSEMVIANARLTFEQAAVLQRDGGSEDVTRDLYQRSAALLATVAPGIAGAAIWRQWLSDLNAG